MQDEDVVPFGKYRGQPVSNLLGDANYCSWLLLQPWARERYPTICERAAGGSAQPADAPTPEHNRLQARFADPVYARRVYNLLKPLPGERPLPALEPLQEALTAAEKIGGAAQQVAIEALDAAAAIWEEQTLRLAGHPAPKVSFEDHGWDVSLQLYRFEPDFSLELKPTIADEYPSIVRTVRKRAEYRVGRPYAGAPVIAFDRWLAEMPLATVREMFPDIIWLQLPPA